jgi:fatty acid-binding protein DegV
MGLLDLSSAELNTFIVNNKSDKNIIDLLDSVKDKIKTYVRFENLDTNFKIKIETNFNIIEW